MATKRNALGVLMGIELVLNGANINLVAFGSKYLREDSLGLDGSLMALFVIVLAAAEAAVVILAAAGVAGPEARDELGTLNPPLESGSFKGICAPGSKGRPSGSGAPITAICWLVNRGGVWHSAQRATKERKILSP